MTLDIILQAPTTTTTTTAIELEALAEGIRTQCPHLCIVGLSLPSSSPSLLEAIPLVKSQIHQSEWWWWWRQMVMLVNRSGLSSAVAREEEKEEEESP